MARRILSRINGAYVIATIALFAALGGGYAVAFSGSGSLQKAGEVGITGSAGGGTVDEVRTLIGIGAIGATCNTSASGDIGIEMRNSSGVGIDVYGNDSDGGTISRNVGAGNAYDDIFGSIESGEAIDLHVVQVDGTKSPQAHIQIAVSETGNCTTSTVQVMALNTQQP